MNPLLTFFYKLIRDRLGDTSEEFLDAPEPEPPAAQQPPPLAQSRQPLGMMAFAPEYYPIGKYWSFCLMNADPELVEFIEGLPCVQRACFDTLTGVLHVILSQMDATDQDTAYECYSAVWQSIQARREVPVDDVWTDFYRTLDFNWSGDKEQTQ